MDFFAYIISMNTPIIPAAPETLESLNPLLTVVFEALESGTLHAREYFEQQGDQPVEPYLYAHLVRYRAKQHLETHGHAVQFTTDDIAYSGLQVCFDRYRVRILKADQGDVPAPGISNRRQQFWAQLHLNIDQLSMFEDGTPPPVNLLVIWDVDGRHNLAPLTLACPKGGGTHRRSVEVYWHIPIPHPAERVEPQVSSFDDDDLDITLIDLEPRDAQEL